MLNNVCLTGYINWISDPKSIKGDRQVITLLLGQSAGKGKSMSFTVKVFTNNQKDEMKFKNFKKSNILQIQGGKLVEEKWTDRSGKEVKNTVIHCNMYNVEVLNKHNNSFTKDDNSNSGGPF